MDDVDGFETQPDARTSIASELESVGFHEAHEIGHGGFGVVYRCTQASLDRKVAVKVLIADSTADNRDRFVREQQAMGKLTGHPNIVSALQTGFTEKGRPFIVMQCHERGSLDRLIRNEGPRPLEDVLRLGVKMAGALEIAHRNGILHRDVKPANVLFTDYGEPVLTDFGIAHIVGGFETAIGVVTGTPGFIAPEVLGGQRSSPKSDIYSLGATLFCAIAGYAAFERRTGEPGVAQFVRIAKQPVPDLRDRGIANDLSLVLERAMADDSQVRFNATELGNALRESQRYHRLAVDHMAIQPTPKSTVGNTKLELDSRRVPRRVFPVGAKANLPLELTSFVGRRRELTEAKNLLAESRLVTCTGIGGVGKTRLAIRLATSLQRRFVDGVWFAELGELQDEALVVDVVAGALGIRYQSSMLLDEILVQFLAPRELLLVLDSCEHLVAGVAELAEILLRTCPRVRILATSREALGIVGESTLLVPPLAIPELEPVPTLRSLARYDGVALFAVRAAAAVSAFELTEENRATVVQICHRLDGLPLPIELAAARLRALSLEQILERLTDRYALLARGSRGAPARLQNLRSCVDWSYELCTPQEQLLWSRLSVFAGSMEIDAAESVCNGEMAPQSFLDVLATLVDKSILIREEQAGAVRFRLLETLREYGLEKLQQSGEKSEMRRRHRDWYHQLLLTVEAEWIGPRQLEWIARLTREQSNLREALEYCATDADESGIETGLRIGAAAYLFWSARGLHAEGRHWLGRLLARPNGRSTTPRIKSLCVNSTLAAVQGDVSAGSRLVVEARRLAVERSESLTDAYVDHADGLLALFSGEHLQACSCFERALEVFRAESELNRQVEALELLGVAYDLLNDLPGAIRNFEEVLEITRSRGESVYRSYSCWGMGVALWRQMDWSGATAFSGGGLRLAQRADEPLGAAVCIETLAWIASSTGKAKRAAVLMGAAEMLRRGSGGSAAFVPNLLSHHDESERLTRNILGDERFQTSRREGNAMDFDSSVAYALNEHAAGTTSSPRSLNMLTKRERQVAELVTEGLTNREIASRLFISLRTAQGHVEHVLAKLGFSSRAQIAAWFVDPRQNPTKGP